MDEDCLKLTAYFGERKRVGDVLVADALLDVCERHQIATSVLLRGVEGFGLRHHLRTDTSLSLSEDLPAVAVAVDSRPRIEGMLDDVARLGSGLVTVERARLQTGRLAAVELPEELDEATKLTVYLGRRERAGDLPAFRAVVDLLHRRGIAGASVLLGVDGTVAGRRERARFFSRNAAVPVMVVAVGRGAQIAELAPELGALLPHPTVTFERVRLCKRDGVLVGRPHALPGTDEHGLAIWQQLVIYTSEAQLHAGRPIHREITRRLRRSGARGATTLRGIWGFAGDRSPHGDRVFQRGRHVPTVTVVVDAPDRIADAFPVIDELTAERGLVTSEMVPAMRASAGEHGKGGLQLATHHF